MSELVLNQMEDVGGADELSQTKSEPTYLRRNRPGTSSKVSLDPLNHRDIDGTKMFI